MDNHIDKLNEFYKEYAEKNNGSISDLIGHNIYLIEVEDLDGNIVRKGYAKNLILNNSFTSQFQSGSFQYASDLYIGRSSDPPSVTDTGLHEPITSSSAIDINVGDGLLQDSCCYYDADSDRIYSSRFAYQGYFDYVISGITTPQEIRELSLNNNTRALVYDEHGLPSYILKDINEKLTITCYISTEMKPRYVVEKLKAQGYVFTLHPWAFMYGGRTLNDSNWPDRYYTAPGCLGSMSLLYGNTLRLYSSQSTASTSNNGNGWYTISRDYNLFANSATTTYDSETNILHCSRVMTSDNILIEDKRVLFDMIHLVAMPAWDYSDRYYVNMMVITKPMELPEPEEIVDEFFYCNSENDNHIDLNLGYYNPSETLRQENHLPVVQLDISSVKRYNGLTHEWDIDRSFTNNPNWKLSMHVMYGCVPIRMWLPFQAVNKDQWITVWHNNFSSVPITSISASDITWWYTETWWDPNSFVQIQDPTNMTPTEGSATFYITLGGYLPRTGINSVTASRAPVWLTRDITIPSLTLNTDTVDVPNFDLKTTADSGNYRNYYGSGFYNRPFYVCESRNYIAFTNTIYYPETQTSYPLTCSYTTLTSNVQVPIPSMRYSETTGQRMLQIFARINGNYYRPCITNVSVFDISDDPTVAPVEHVVDMGSTFSNDMVSGSGEKMLDLTSTETGYVIFTNRSTNRIHVLDLMGNAENDYEPYSYILTDENDNEYVSNGAWAVKYRNWVIFRDSSEVDSWTFRIYDLENKQVIDSFVLDDLTDMTSPRTVEWIRGWKDFLYIQVRNNSGHDSYSTYLYNMKNNPGNRFIETGWGTEVSRNVGCYYTNTSSYNNVWRTTHQYLDNCRTLGDEDCLLLPRITTSGGDSALIGLWYIDEAYPLNPVAISRSTYNNSVSRSDDAGTLCSLNIGVINQGKERILGVAFHPSADGNRCRAIQFYDLNWIRDNRKAPNCISAWNGTFGTHALSNSSDWNFPFFGIATYKDKTYVVTYSDNRAYTPGYLEIVDPERLLPHKMTGTTTTFQAYNNPKRVYGINNFWMECINNPDIYNPDDWPEEEDPQV